MIMSAIRVSIVAATMAAVQVFAPPAQAQQSREQAAALQAQAQGMTRQIAGSLRSVSCADPRVAETAAFYEAIASGPVNKNVGPGAPQTELDKAWHNAQLAIGFIQQMTPAVDAAGAHNPLAVNARGVTLSIGQPQDLACTTPDGQGCQMQAYAENLQGAIQMTVLKQPSVEETFRLASALVAQLPRLALQPGESVGSPLPSDTQPAPAWGMKRPSGEGFLAFRCQ